jgi:hypothetical protein
MSFSLLQDREGHRRTWYYSRIEKDIEEPGLTPG